MSQKERDKLGKAYHRLRILKYAEEITHNVAKTCLYYGIAGNKYYFWKKRYEQKGIEELKNQSRASHCGQR